MWKIRRILALCLCLVLLAGTACAEEIHKLGGGYWGYLNHGCTLPDGRLVLVGTKSVGEANPVTEAWVLCLNPDLTVSWEAVDKGRSGDPAAEEAVLLPDGTLAVVFDDYVNDRNVSTVKTYTQDGEPTGREFSLPEGLEILDAGPSWLMMFSWDGETGTGETVLFDWDDREVLRYDGLALPDGYGYTVGNTDGLVLCGRDAMENGYAKILKLDRQNGEVVWETTMERQLPDTEDSRFRQGTGTEDGGYAVLMDERKTDPDTQLYAWTSFLVKLDAEGRVQWINGESFARENLEAYRVFSCNGKLAVLCGTPQKGTRESFLPILFRWFDMDGKEIGTTEVQPDLEDFPVLQRYLAWEGDERQPEPVFSVETLISATDGIWALGRSYVSTTDSEGISGMVVNSNEVLLIRITEP